jgi:hypothetical protein
MEVPNHIVCDVCGAAKGETNHWIVAITVPHRAGIMFIPADAVDDPRNPQAKYEDICGHACAHKRFSQWLETPWI